MATAPKAVPDATPEGGAPPPKKSKMMLFIIIGVVFALAGGGGAYMFMSKHKEKPAKAAAGKIKDADAKEGDAKGKDAGGEEGDAEADPDAASAEATAKEEEEVHEAGKPPVFVVIDPFTVNLQSESGTDQFLQIAFTIQVKDEHQQDLVKLYMPQVRSRMLMLLSSKKASEINTVDGKKKLSEEIIAQIKQSFEPKGKAQSVSNVFFTSFVIQ